MQGRPIRRTDGEADHQPRSHVLHGWEQYRAAHEARECEAEQDDDGGYSPTDEEDPHGNLAGRGPGLIPGPGYQGHRRHGRCDGEQGTQDGPW